MPTIALDFVSKRISVLPTARPLYGTASYARNRAYGTSSAQAVSRASASGDGAASGVSTAQGGGRSFAPFGAGACSGQASASAAGAFFSRLGAGSAAGTATADAVAATTVAVTGASTAQTIACAAYSPLAGIGSGSAVGAAAALAVSSSLTSTSVGAGAAAGSATATAFDSKAAGSAAGVGSALAAASTTLVGSGTLAGVGSSTGVATASATSLYRFGGVGSSAGSATAAALAGLRPAAGASSGGATVVATGASVAARPPFVIHGHATEFFADGHLWATQFGYDPAGGIGSFNSTRLIATNDDGAAWKTFNDYTFPRVYGYPVVEGASDLRIVTSSYFGGAVSGQIAWVNKSSLSAYNGRLSWNIFNLMANGSEGAAIGSQVAVSDTVSDGGYYYCVGGDAIDLVNSRMQIWTVQSTFVYTASVVGVVSTDPSDPNKRPSGPEFGLTISRPDGPSGSWKTFKKYSGRWFWIVGDIPNLYYNDNNPPTAGWRRIPLDIGDGGRVVGLRQVGGYLVAWGARPNTTQPNVAWSADNGNTWTTVRAAGMAAGLELASDSGAAVAGGRLVIQLSDNTKYIHTTDPSSGFTLRTDLGASVFNFVQAGSAFYATYIAGASLSVVAKTTDGLTFTPLSYPKT